MILVTGASGLLGTSMVTRARETGRTIAAIARSGGSRTSGVDIQPLDLGDPAATTKLVLRLHPPTIIHCAAATDVDWCEDHPDEAYRVNVTASEHLAQLAQKIGAAFVQVSTDSVFDGEKGNYSETDVPRPLNVYAKTKLLAEKAVLQVHSSPLVLRVNFYGSGGLKKQKLADWILQQLSSGKTVQGFTDVFFCPMLANDLVDAVFEMLDADLSGIYHLVGSQKISKYEFAIQLATICGFDPSLVVPGSLDSAELRATRPRDLSLSSAKISAALGRKMPDVDSGLRKFNDLRRLRRCELEAGALQ